MPSCSLTYGYQNFGSMCCLHLQTVILIRRQEPRSIYLGLGDGQPLNVDWSFTSTTEMDICWEGRTLMRWQLSRRRPSAAAHIEWQVAGRRVKNVAPLHTPWGQDTRNGAEQARGLNTPCFSTVGPQKATGSRIPARVNSVERSISLKTTSCSISAKFPAFYGT